MQHSKGVAGFALEVSEDLQHWRPLDVHPSAGAIAE